MRLSESHNGYLSIFAAFLCYIVIGIFYVWGSVSVYVLSHYNQLYNSNLGLTQAALVLPVMELLGSLTISISTFIIKKAGLRTALFLEGMLSAYLVFDCLQSEFWIFILMFAVCFGANIGLLYVPPMDNVYAYFPERKQILSSFIMSALPWGTIISIMMMQLLVNPKNQNPKEEVMYFYTFDKSVSEKLPFGFHILGLFIAVLTVLAVIFIRPKSDLYASFQTIDNLLSKADGSHFSHNRLQIFGNSDLYVNVEPKSKEFEVEVEDRSLSSNSRLQGKHIGDTKDFTERRFFANDESDEFIDLTSGLKSVKFYIVCLMIFLFLGSGYFFSSNYKFLGFHCGFDDFSLTLVGGVIAFTNQLGRTLFSLVKDRFTLSKLIITLLVLNTILLIPLTIFQPNFTVYLLINSGISAIFGCLKVICPLLSVKVFGDDVGISIFPFIYMAETLSNFGQFFVVTQMNEYWDHRFVCIVYMIYLVISIMFMVFIPFLRKI